MVGRSTIRELFEYGNQRAAVVGRCCVRRLWGGMRRRRAEKWKECPIKAGGGIPSRFRCIRGISLCA